MGPVPADAGREREVVDPGVDVAVEPAGRRVAMHYGDRGDPGGVEPGPVVPGAVRVVDDVEVEGADDRVAPGGEGGPGQPGGVVGGGQGPAALGERGERAGVDQDPDGVGAVGAGVEGVGDVRDGPVGAVVPPGEQQ